MKHLVISIIRVALDLKLFEILAEREDSMKVEELAEKTGAEGKLLGECICEPKSHATPESHNRGYQ
jgi:hypothetical protein